MVILGLIGDTNEETFLIVEIADTTAVVEGSRPGGSGGFGTDLRQDKC